MRTLKISAICLISVIVATYFTSTEATVAERSVTTTTSNMSDGGERGTCSNFWTPYIHHSDSNFDETSFNSISTCNDIAICLTGNNTGVEGTFSWSIYEVDSGVSSLKTSGYVSQPWSGCKAIFVNNLDTGSRVRLVVSASDYESYWQMDAY